MVGGGSTADAVENPFREASRICPFLVEIGEISLNRVGPWTY
jgi:hypothetical protein